jgi:hypothetical protein
VLDWTDHGQTTFPAVALSANVAALSAMDSDSIRSSVTSLGRHRREEPCQVAVSGRPALSMPTGHVASSQPRCLEAVSCRPAAGRHQLLRLDSATL